MKKRLLAILLGFVLLFTSMPFGAADDADPEQDPATSFDGEALSEGSDGSEEAYDPSFAGEEGLPEEPDGSEETEPLPEESSESDLYYEELMPETEEPSVEPESVLPPVEPDEPEGAIDIPEEPCDASGTCGDNLTWTFTESTGTLTISGTGAMKDYYSYSSTAPWSSCSKKIKSVIVGDGVTTIGNYAFYNCSVLTSVELPESLISIGEGAISTCAELPSITIPEGITTVGNRAFYNCTKLATVVIADSVTSIGELAFCGCSGLKSITMPCSTSIKAIAFAQCSSVVSVHLTAGTGTWTSSSYELYPWHNSRDKLQTFVMDEGIKSIGAYACQDCVCLMDVVIPESVKSIGTYAFSGCTGLTSITIPDGVRSIANYAFSDCTELMYVTMPCSTDLGYRAFYQCTSVYSAHLTKGTGTWINDGQLAAPWLQSRCDTVTFILDEGIKNIPRNAFSNFNRLKKVTIPASITEIAEGAFYRCSGLNAITVAFGNSSYCTVDGALFTTDLSNLIVYPAAKEQTEYAIPDSVSHIGYGAFSGNAALTKITIPESVTSIGVRAFYECKGLTEIEFPSGVTVIPEYVCTSCINLNKVAFLGNVTEIGQFAFYACSKITKFVIPDGITTIAVSTFNYCNKLQSVELPGSIESISNSAFSGCSSLSDVYYHGTAQTQAAISIGNNNTNLTNAQWHYILSGLCGETMKWSYMDGVLTISGSGTMYDYTPGTAPWTTVMKQISELVIEDGVIGIGSSAFSGCVNLTAVTLGSDITSVGEDAFGGCSNLSDVYYNGTRHTCATICFKAENDYLMDATWHYLKEIGGKCGDNLFWGLDTLSGCMIIYGSGAMYDWTSADTQPWAAARDQIFEVEIEEGTTSIGSNAFACCTDLTRIEIPASVTYIGSNAFAGCLGLTEFTVAEENLQYCAVDGVLLNTNQTRLLAYPAANTRTAYELPSTITSIDAYAFSGSVALCEITVPTGLAAIGESAFSDCEQLSDVYYHGTKQMRSTISTGFGNDELQNAEWHYLTNVVSLTMANYPSKQDYHVGEALDVTDGRLLVSYDIDVTETEMITPDMVTGYDPAIIGTQTLTVTLESASTTYTVTVYLHIPDAPVCENEVAPTCTQEGHYENVVYCFFCHEELSRTYRTIPALGHNWAAPEYIWASDNSTVTATRVCRNDASHFESETATTTGTVTKPATCTEKGETTYNASFASSAFSSQSKTVADIPALGHTPGEPVRENEVAPTYLSAGHYDIAVYCTVCHAEISRKTYSIGTLPFTATIEWNSEDVQYKGMTAYVIANGSAQTPRFTVKNNADGSVISPSYYDYEYRENTNAGTGYVYVTFKNGPTGFCRGQFKIYLPATTETTVENTAGGILLTWQPVEGAAGYVIYRRAWSSTTNGWTAFARWDNTTETTYLDGHDTAHPIYAGTRYQYGVKAYFARRTDPITGKEIGGNVNNDSGNFNLGLVGPLKTTVRITTRTLKSAADGVGQITVTWGASSNFTGYELQYDTNASFSNHPNTIKISNPKTIKRVVKLVTLDVPGTTFYFRIRSYHIFEGMTYYGGWSNVKSARSLAKYRAVLIGESDYTGANSLPGCANDLVAMNGMLLTLGTPFATLTKKNATYAEIISAIRTMADGSVDDGVSIFYYSGHGLSAKYSDGSYNTIYHGALCPIDDQYITFSKLASELSNVKGRIVVILDSCHSGAAIRSTSSDPEELLDSFNNAAIEAFSGYDLETGKRVENTRMGELKQSKFIVITAAAYDQSSFDGSFDGSGYKQGAFTAAVIKGMGCKYLLGVYQGSMPADKNGDGNITLKELYDYTYTTAYSWTYKSSKPQRAQYYGPDTEVLFHR